MRVYLPVALALLVGIGIGAAAVQSLQAHQDRRCIMSPRMT
jgi:hypothetical protein